MPGGMHATHSTQVVRGGGATHADVTRDRGTMPGLGAAACVRSSWSTHARTHTNTRGAGCWIASHASSCAERHGTCSTSDLSTSSSPMGSGSLTDGDSRCVRLGEKLVLRSLTCKGGSGRRARGNGPHTDFRCVCVCVCWGVQ